MDSSKVDPVQFLLDRAEHAEGIARGQENEAAQLEAEAARCRADAAKFNDKAVTFRQAAETLKIANAGVDHALRALGVS
jgi:hypothetical protein